MSPNRAIDSVDARTFPPEPPNMYFPRRRLEYDPGFLPGPRQKFTNIVDILRGGKLDIA